MLVIQKRNILREKVQCPIIPLISQILVQPISDLIKKALRKLAGQALRTAKQSLRPLKKIKTTEVNEIDLLKLGSIVGW
jgi:hypothetical protein